MRKNKWTKIEDFISVCVGEWKSSCDHWFELNFLYNGCEYWLHTGTICAGEGEIVKLFLLDEKSSNGNDYKFLEQFSNIENLLASRVICGRPFAEIIIDPETKILDQD